jgi:hypothetical protein
MIAKTHAEQSMTPSYVDEYMEASDKLLMRVLQNVSTP